MSKSVDNKQRWILAGYELFGDIGPSALNVEKLSNILGLNRSSFYHYFGDMEVFESRLLAYHVERYEHFYQLMKDYDKFEQLFSQEIMQHKSELAFQRQLMINQSTTRYKQCSEDAREHTEEKTFQLWTAYSQPAGDEKTTWDIFRALRDFYYIHFGQKVSENETNPQDVLVILQSYFYKSKE